MSNIDRPHLLLNHIRYVSEGTRGHARKHSSAWVWALVLGYCLGIITKTFI